MSDGWDFSSLDGAGSGSGWDFSGLDDPGREGFDWTGAARKLYPLTALKDAYDASGPVLGMTGRASDYVLGAGARGIAAVEEPIVQGLASARGVESSPETQAMLESIAALRAKGEALQAGTTDYGSALAEEIPRAEGGFAGHASGVARGAVRMGGNFARDPLTYVALGKIAKLPSWAMAAAAGLFTAQGAEGALRSLGNAREAAYRDNNEEGWAKLIPTVTPEVTENLTEAALGAYMTRAGARHTIGETARALGEYLPKGGRIYEADPNATPEEVAARRAETVAENVRSAEQQAARVDQIGRAGRRLLFERSAALKPTKGAQAAMEPEAGTPEAKALFEAERLAYEALATPSKTGRPAAVGRVESLGKARAGRPADEPAQPAGLEYLDWLKATGKPASRGAMSEWEAYVSGESAPAAATGEPPVPKGHVRVYRGEVPGWDYASDPSYGKTGSTSRRVAEEYAGEGGVVKYVDVPEDSFSAGANRIVSSGDKLLGGAEVILSDDAAAAFQRLPPSRTAKPSKATLSKGPLVERQGPVGQPNLTPRQARMVRKRLLQLWAEEGGPLPLEPAPIGGRGLEALVDPKPQSITDRIGEALVGAAGRFVRAVEPGFDAVALIPGVGREISGRLRATAEAQDVGLGKSRAGVVRALQEAMGLRRPLGAQDLLEGPGPIRDWLIKQDEAQKLLPVDELPAELRGPAEKIRAVKLGQRQRAIDMGALDTDAPLGLWPKKPTPEVAPRFTHEAKVLDLARRMAKQQGREQPTEKDVGDAEAQLNEPGSLLVGGTRTGRKPGSLYERVTGEAGLQPGEYRTDWGSFLESLREVEHSLAETQHLGPDGSTVQHLINRIPKGGKFGDQAFAQKLVDRVREVEQQTSAHAVSSKIRGYQAATGLVKSPVTQLATLQNTAAEAGVINTMKAVSETFLKQPKGPDGKPMRWTQPVKRLRAALNDARLSAEEQGALMASHGEGVMDYYLRTRTQETPGVATTEGGFSSKVAQLPHIRATGWTDTLQRVIAANTAKFAVPDQWAKAKAGDVGAQRQLDRWHVDWRREALTPEAIDTAAKRISDLTQFKVGTGDIPLWASSPWGKVAFQFQSFGYAHTRLMGHVMDEGIRRGNWAPLARLATIGAATGYATDEVKRAIFGGQAPENPTEEDFKTAMANAFSGRKHYAPGSPEGLALAAAEGLGAAGGLGALGSLYERVSSGSVSKVALGATGADVEAIERLAMAAATGKDLGRPVLSLAAGLAPTGPVGLNPREVLRELASKKPIPNPGYAGRIMDAAGAGPGAEARAVQGELERNAAATKRERDAMEKNLTPRPPAADADRLKESRRERLRAELMRELSDAIRTGNKARELSVYRRAAEGGIRDMWRSGLRLRGRAIPAEVNP